MKINRRSLLKYSSLIPLLGAGSDLAAAADQPSAGKADYTVHIATGLAELAPDHIVSTTLYNGQFPGPLIRFREGQRVVVDIHNDTDTPELLHWHGQMIPSDVDGASEEGTPFVPAHGMRRISFVPKPAGFRFYHTHVAAFGDLNRGTYTGQAGPVYIEPKNHPGAYDREVFLVMKEFLPSFSQGGDMATDALPGGPVPSLGHQKSGAGGAAEDQRRKSTKLPLNFCLCSRNRYVWVCGGIMPKSFRPVGCASSSGLSICKGQSAYRLAGVKPIFSQNSPVRRSLRRRVFRDQRHPRRR